MYHLIKNTSLGKSEYALIPFVITIIKLQLINDELNSRQSWTVPYTQALGKFKIKLNFFSKNDQFFYIDFHLSKNLSFPTTSKANKRTCRFKRNKDASKKTRISRLRVHETYMRLWTVRLRIPLQRARSWLWPQASELERDVGARSVTRGTYNHVQTNWYIHRRLRRSERVFPRAYAPAARERGSERVGGIATTAKRE